MLGSPVSLFYFGVLMLGHAIADFVLQSESIALGKVRHTRILALHVLHHVLTMALLLLLAWVALRNAPDQAAAPWGELGVLLVVVGLSHWLIDRIKILVDLRLRREVWSFIIDQLLHISVLWIAVFVLSNRSPHLELAQVPPLTITRWSVTFDRLVELSLWAAGIILAVRGGAILLYLLSQNLLRSVSSEVLECQGIPARPLADERTLLQGYVERFVALSLLLTSLAWLVAAVYVLKALLLRRRLLGEGSPEPLRRWLTLEYSASIGTVLVVGIGLKILLA